MTSISCRYSFSIVALNFFCFGIPSTNASVCSGRGSCSGPDTCSCQQNYFGTKCELTTCSGINSNDARVCSGFGTCTAFDVCTCDPQYAADYSGNKDCYRNVMVIGAGYNPVITQYFFIIVRRYW
jgi:hypothetical protein